MMMNKGEKRKSQERTIKIGRKEGRMDGWMWNGDEENDFLRRGED